MQRQDAAEGGGAESGRASLRAVFSRCPHGGVRRVSLLSPTHVAGESAAASRACVTRDQK